MVETETTMIDAVDAVAAAVAPMKTVVVEEVIAVAKFVIPKDDLRMYHSCTWYHLLLQRQNPKRACLVFLTCDTAAVAAAAAAAPGTAICLEQVQEVRVLLPPFWVVVH